jgi:DNA-binding response OmpR family regulator
LTRGGIVVIILSRGIYAKMTKILLVEDDNLLGESLTDFLEIEGFSIKWIDDDRIVMQTFSVEMFDIVVMDLMLKYQDGESLIKKIKERLPDLPIIVITAKDSIKSKELCFSLGADDYITKPFNPKELILRIKAVCRRFYQYKKTEEIGDLKIDTIKKTITKNGKEISLTNKEWGVLLFLIKRRNKIVTHDEILNYIWADKDVGEDSVRAYIKKLRTILPPDSIETYKGRGYKLK